MVFWLTVGPRVHQYPPAGPDKSKLTGSDKSNLVDQYTALLLAIFIDAGLVEVRRRRAFANFRLSSNLLITHSKALINLVEEEASLLTRKATLLIGEVLILASRVLPYNISARVQVSCPTTLFPK